MAEGRNVRSCRGYGRPPRVRPELAAGEDSRAMASLSDISAIADQKTRIDKYKELQARCFQLGQVDELKALIDHST